jgi:hypothetical protein
VDRQDRGGIGYATEPISTAYGSNPDHQPGASRDPARPGLTDNAIQPVPIAPVSLYRNPGHSLGEKAFSHPPTRLATTYTPLTVRVRRGQIPGRKPLNPDRLGAINRLTHPSSACELVAPDAITLYADLPVCHHWRARRRPWRRPRPNGYRAGRGRRTSEHGAFRTAPQADTRTFSGNSTGSYPRHRVKYPYESQCEAH